MTELEKSNDLMRERGKIVLNSHEFIIKPVFIGEEERYLREVSVSPMPMKSDNEEITTETKFTDKELTNHIMAIFTSKNVKFAKLKQLFNKVLFFINKDSIYNGTHAQGLVKWISKKVYYKGKRVKFYDLERKFELSKAEIEKLIIEIHKVSGF